MTRDRQDESTNQRTSLEISEVSVRGCDGRIGIPLFPPGKGDLEGTLWPTDRELDRALDAVQSWGATAVVCLLRESEMEQSQVRTLSDAVQDRHMEWWHVPVEDGQVRRSSWEPVFETIRDRLELGFNVLIHGIGGLERDDTGTVRLHIADGGQQTAAIELARKAPGRTPEGSGPLELLSVPSQPSERPEDIRDRAMGAFIGLAVGDATGAQLEGTWRDQEPRLLGIDHVLRPGYPIGNWTDDTAMALALADSLIANDGLSCRDLMDRFVAWLESGEYSCWGECWGIGEITHRSLERYRRAGDPMAGPTDPQTAGNGTLMRLAPVASRFWADRSRLETIAAEQSKTTHATAEAVDACRGYALMLADAIAGKPRSEVLAPRAFDGAPAITEILGGRWRGRPRHEIKSSGYVVDTLEAAIWSVARTGNFQNAVLLAANLGHDADTVAAVAGQLAGALYGLSGIPQEWVELLAWKDRLLETAQKLAEPVPQSALLAI